MPAQSIFPSLSVAFCLLGALLCQPAPVAAQGSSTNRPHHLQYEKDIQAFEAADKTNPPPAGAILLVGSSSIRKWTNAPAQFPHHRLIMRGFGGSYVADSVAFADRIVIPYKPKLILLYAGDNDIAADKSPAQVFKDFKDFVVKVQVALPKTRIAFIAIKPSPSRIKFINEIKAANELIQEFITEHPGLVYVDIYTPMLGADAKPRAELFVSDQLHLNDAGYKLWASIIKPVLEK